MTISPIIDSSVLVDMFLETSARHAVAASLADALIARDVELAVPGFALFEVRSALSQAKIEHRLKMANGITKSRPLKIRIVPIDEAFVERYLDPSLPHLKGCDLVFLAMAKRDGAPLVTEDAKMYEAAKATGVAVYITAEYLASLE